MSAKPVDPVGVVLAIRMVKSYEKQMALVREMMASAQHRRDNAMEMVRAFMENDEDALKLIAAALPNGTTARLYPDESKTRALYERAVKLYGEQNEINCKGEQDGGLRS